jgi:hypothetical protein
MTFHDFQQKAEFLIFQQKITHKTIKLVCIASLLKASSTGVGNFINISWIKYSEVS